MFRVDDSWPLRRIRDDLTRYDIHPPLYFWLLHAQFLVSGATPWAFVLLNFILGALTIVMVFAVGRRLWDPSTGAAAALLWAVSHGALITSLNARPYALAALLTLFLLRLAIIMHERSGRPALSQSLFLGAVMLLGLLTHYQFPFVIVAVGIGLVLAGYNDRPRRAIVFGVLALVAFAAFASLLPGFVASLERQRAQTPSFTAGDLPWRLRRFALGLLGLARPAYDRSYLAILSVLLALGSLWRSVRAGALRRVSGSGRLLREAAAGVKLVAWTTIALTVFTALLYLLHLSPPHAVGDRYNASLWPLFALLIAGAVRAVVPDRMALTLLALAIFLLTYQLAARIDAEQQALVTSREWRTLSVARVVVADHSQRGILPRTVLRVPAISPLWIGGSSTDPDSLMKELRGKGAPVTFLLNRDLGDPRVRRAMEKAVATGDSLVSVGVVPGETEVVVWTPARLRQTPRSE